MDLHGLHSIIICPTGVQVVEGYSSHEDWGRCRKLLGSACGESAKCANGRQRPRMATIPSLRSFDEG